MQLIATNVVSMIAGFSAAVIVTTLVHELGHLAAIRLLRIPVRRIAVGMGPVFWRRSLDDDSEFVVHAIPTGMSVGVPGRRNPDGTPRRPIRHDVFIAAAGPMMSVFLAVLFWGAAQMSELPDWSRVWFASTALLSLFLGVANLVPVPGLDGGHLVLLGAARLGLQLSPDREMQVHQVGVRAVAAACLAISAVFVGVRLLGIL